MNSIRVISHPRSGLTWLRWLAFAASRRLRPEMYEHSKLEKKNRLFRFSHDWMGVRKTTRATQLERLQTNPWKWSEIVFLYRDPRDVLWSNWHLIGRNVGVGSFSDFLRHEVFGLDSLIEWLCWWNTHRAGSRSWSVIQYESMIEDTVSELSWFLDVVGFSLGEDELQEIVDDCSFKKMQQYEQEHGSILPDVRSSAGFCVRRGRVGQWEDWLKEDREWASEKLTLLEGTFAAVL